MQGPLIIFSSGHLAAAGLAPEDLARSDFIRSLAAAGLTAEIRIVSELNAQAIGPVPAGADLLLVGPATPPAGLAGPFVRVLTVNLADLSWMGPVDPGAVLALIRSTLAGAGLLEGPCAPPEPTGPRVLLVGRSATAIRLKERLEATGIEIIQTDALRPIGSREIDSAQSTENDPATRLVGFTGLAGRFTAQVAVSGVAKRVLVGAVVLVDLDTTPEMPPTGPWPTIPLSAASEADLPPGADRTVVFLPAGPAGSPHGFRRILELAATWATRPGIRVAILAPQIKVAGTGLERLYGQAREAGALFFRTPDAGPALVTNPDGRQTYRVHDSVARTEVSIRPDMVIAEETQRPTEGLAAWAAEHGLELGPDGFPGPDNILFSPICTNRRGVLALGPARSTLGPEAREREIDRAATELIQLLGDKGHKTSPILFDPDRCASCLTCFRSCPHGAIFFTGQPYFDPLACQACGTCVALCPGRALQLAEAPDESGKARMAALLNRPRGAAFEPRILLLACERSALAAMKLALRPPERVDLSVLPLPCGGFLETGALLRAFSQGADGVLVATCHEDNCRSQTGAPLARMRVIEMRQTLSLLGWAPERLGLVTLAPNMGPEFATAVMEFRATLLPLGPTATQPGS